MFRDPQRGHVQGLVSIILWSCNYWGSKLPYSTLLAGRERDEGMDSQLWLK